jgi:YndJ-like protein
LQLASAARRDAGARATRARATSSIAIAVAKIDLAVGGAWLVASRLGMRPMGIQEPIGLLTAVHFHFAGFATAMIAAAMLRFAERGIPPCGEERDDGGPTLRPREDRIPLFENRPSTSLRASSGWGDRVLGVIVMLVIGMPYVVAAGFVISPALKMGAAMVFSASVAGLAVFLRAQGWRANDRVARVLLQVAPVAVFAGMVLAGVYAVADFMKSDALPIPQMARTHGILNAVGFCLPGLLGWVVESSGQGPGVADQRR